MRNLDHIRLISILSFTILLFGSCGGQVYAQTYGNKAFYLLDSLDLGAIDREDQKIVDSSLTIFHRTKEDTTKINALNIIVEESWDDNVWMKYNDLILSLCDKMEANTDPSDKIRIRFIKRNKALGLNNKGYFYDKLGLTNLALENYHKALMLSEEIEHWESMASILNNLGFVYKSQDETDKAVEYYTRSLELRKKIEDSVGIGTCYNNLGAVYDKMGEKTKALDYYQKSLAIRTVIGDQRGVAYLYDNIGYLYFEANLPDKALNYFGKALRIQKQLRDEKGLAVSYMDIGNIYFDVKNFNKAKLYADSSLLYATKTGYPESIKGAATLNYRISKYVGDDSRALEFFQLKIKMEDSVKNTQLQRLAIQQETAFKYKKQKAINDADHEKRIALEQKEKEQQRLVIIFVSVLTILISISTFIIFNRLKLTRKQKRIIQEQKKEVELQRDKIDLQKKLVEEKHEEIQASIVYAKRIQNAILPTSSVVHQYFPESFILYRPKDVVAGDFYWIEKLKNVILFAVADCTGHGVPGAMVSVVCNNALNRAVREFKRTEPAQILDKTREIVVAEFEKSEDDVKDGMDIALCALVSNEETSSLSLQYSGAHNPLWLIRNNELIEVKADKQPIGKFDSYKPYINHSLELQSGDLLYIFSDGFADQFGGPKGKKLGYRQFRELLLENNQKSMSEQKSILLEKLEAWMVQGNEEQVDDVCVIGVRL